MIYSILKWRPHAFLSNGGSYSVSEKKFETLSQAQHFAQETCICSDHEGSIVLIAGFMDHETVYASCRRTYIDQSDRYHYPCVVYKPAVRVDLSRGDLLTLLRQHEEVA